MKLKQIPAVGIALAALAAPAALRAELRAEAGFIPLGERVYS